MSGPPQSRVERKTVCNRDCPDTCSIVATVENERVVALRGDREHPVTRGALCYRTNHFLQTQYSPSRLTQPLLRTRGELQPVSWDTALDFVPKTTAEGPVADRGQPYPRGAEIPGVPPLSPRTLLGQASAVIPTAQESLVRMSESVQKFDRAAPKIEKAAEEFGALSRSAREFIPELRQTNARLQELLGAAEPQPDPLKPPA